MQKWRWRAMGAVLFGACAGAGEPVALAADAPPLDARLALSLDGHIGAWLVAGPFDRANTPDEEHLSPHLNDAAGGMPNAPRWRLASTNDGALDVAAAIDSRTYGVAYAAGVLHVERGGRYLLLLGAGDAVGVLVDGKRALSRDDPRPERDDEDLIPLDLARGDHCIVLGLRRRGIPRSLRARLLDEGLAPPVGSWWLLPGTTGDDARALGGAMSLVSLDRGLGANGYQPVLTVRFPGGAPRGVPLDVRARLVRAAPVDGVGALFDVDAGDVPVDDRAVGSIVVRLPRVASDEVEDDDWIVHVEVVGRTIDCPFHPRRAVRAAVSRAERALVDAQGSPMHPGSLESVEHLRERLVTFVGKGDADIDAQLDEAREIEQLSSSLEQQQDPYVGRIWRTGVMRRAYRSPADGQLSEFAIYVPPRFDPKRTYPLIVALHGMNGRPVEMIMWLFGHDDPARDGNWEDRHPRHDLPPLDAIVVAPDGHFNAMYRDLGEEDVMRVIDWTMATYPIDPARVTITGPSMGGIGTAACALHHPARFAAAEPLCGYHSYFVRSDIGARTLRPWEKFIAEQRSNVFWAENGMYLPLYIVHGTKDLPEENSGVLIDRYEELNYDVTHEHPELGHNVWQPTYEDLKGADWLLTHRRPLHPRAIRFKTPRTRWGDDAWLHVRELASSDAWGEAIARIDGKNAVYVSAHGIVALAIERDPARIDDAAPVVVTIDGHKIAFQAGEPSSCTRRAPSGRQAIGRTTGRSNTATSPARSRTRSTSRSCSSGARAIRLRHAPTKRSPARGHA